MYSHLRACLKPGIAEVLKPFNAFEIGYRIIDIWKYRP